MGRAFQLARRGLFNTDPNPRVGCVLVKDNKTAGEGWHQRAGEPHAEINALHDAGKAQARGATAYVTLEPCCHQGKTPPCVEALIEAGVSRVVAAMQDPNPQVAGQGLQALADAGIQVDSGLLQSQAESLNPGFVKRMRYGRPYVRSKLAMSVDGRTALASGESKWITSSAARADVQRLRARSSAIMTGVGTVLADDPSLTVRMEGVDNNPLRVVLDTHLSLPADAKMLGLPGRTLVMTGKDSESSKEELQKAGAEVVTVATRNNSVDPVAVLDYLGQIEMNEVLLEMGATLSGAMLREGLIDEFVIYMAPTLMGHEARPLFRLPGVETMDKKIELEIDDVRAIGRDWRITAKVK